MKIKELLENNQHDISTDSGKLSWLNDNMFRDSSKSNYGWEIIDGKVYGKGDWRLAQSITEIPFQIQSIDGNFIVAGNAIKNFKTFPKTINGRLDVSSCNELDDWSDMPLCWRLEINDCKQLTNLPVQVLQHLKSDLVSLDYHSAYAKSLVGFDKVTKAIRKIVLRTKYLEEGGLGLLTVKDLNELDTWVMPVKLMASFSIIRKYLGRPDDIYECQTEMLNSEYDLEPFTKI